LTRGYPKVDIDNMIKANPGISVIDMARAAVVAHIQREGCEFQANAATRAVDMADLQPDGLAHDLTETQRVTLGRILEEMEIRCADRPTGNGGRPGLALIGWAILVLAAALIQDAMMKPPRIFYAASTPAAASYAPLGPKLEAWDAVSIEDMR
jgi:hypothetical protein